MALKMAEVTTYCSRQLSMLISSPNFHRSSGKWPVTCCSQDAPVSITSHRYLSDQWLVCVESSSLKHLAVTIVHVRNRRFTWSASGPALCEISTRHATLGQVVVDKKSNEITAIPKLQQSQGDASSPRSNSGRIHIRNLGPVLASDGSRPPEGLDRHRKRSDVFSRPPGKKPSP